MERRMMMELKEWKNRKNRNACMGFTMQAFLLS